MLTGAVCVRLQLPLPRLEFLCTLLIPRWYIGIKIHTAHELTRSVWLYDATPNIHTRQKLIGGLQIGGALGEWVQGVHGM